MASENNKKGEKDFGEGIEIVKDEPKEEKDIEINFGSVLSFFRKKGSEAQPSATAAAEQEHKGAVQGKGFKRRQWRCE